MSRKFNSPWARFLALFGSLVATFAIAIVLSPSVFAADLGEVDVDLGASSINPATSPSNNVVQKLTYTGTAASTVTTMTIVNTGATLVDAEIASLRICVDGSNDGDNSNEAENGTYDAGTDACLDTNASPVGITSGTGPFTATLDSAMVVGAGTSATVFIVIDFSTSGNVVDGHTIRLTTNATAGTGDTFAAPAVQATSAKTVNVVATKLKVTGTASQVAGTTNELTVTAKDSNNNTDTSYTGSKDLVFSGPAASPDGSVANVESIAIGSTTATTFTSGASNATTITLTPKKVETTTVDVTDGTLSSTGSAADDLDLTVTVATKAKLMIARQAETSAAINNHFNPQPIVNITDAYGNTTADTDTVTAAPFLAANCTSAAAGTMSGDTKAASAGVATFTALQHNTIETIYIKYTDGVLTAACSGVAGDLLGSISASSVVINRGAQHSDSTSSSSTTTSGSTTSTSSSTSSTTTGNSTSTSTTANEETTTTGEQNQNQNRYEQAGVTESEVDSAVSAFKDLVKDNWVAPFIARMKKLEILAGYPDGSVKPDNKINRAELAKIAVKAFGLANATETFADVPDDAWYAPFVGALQAAGAAWTTGTNYQPEANVTRGEAVWVLLKAAGVDLANTTVEKLFPDVSTKHRFAAAITYAAQNGIVSGYDNGNFGPGDTLTRGQVAKIVALIKDLQK
ncbi:MAG: S-layer homology domain-containing protein [Patescibacteria group bacterium]